jgi:intracellular multiplication protein IcmV
MSILRGVGKIFKPFVNFPRWMDLRSATTTAKQIGNNARDLFVPQKATHVETFEQAVQRLHLTEKDLQVRMKNLQRMVVFYCLIAVALVVYTIHLLMNGNVFAGILGTILTVLALAFAFREHFWYFQMKQRRLGCSVKEWFIGMLKEGQK